MKLRHAKDVNCNHYHNIEVTKLSLVTCLACKNQLNNPEILKKFKELENSDRVKQKLQVINVMNSLATKVEAKGGKICPTCGATMKVRKNSKNGSSFWGCTNYPDCKTTRKIQ